MSCNLREARRVLVEKYQCVFVLFLGSSLDTRSQPVVCMDLHHP